MYNEPCFLARYVGRMVASTSQGCGELGLVFSARTAIQSASMFLARAWSDQVILVRVDFSTLKRSSKRDASPYGKGSDGARLGQLHVMSRSVLASGPAR